MFLFVNPVDLGNRQHEVIGLRSKLLRSTSNIHSKPFTSPSGNGFPGPTDFEHQIAASHRDLANRCFSSCSPANGPSQAQRALSPSAFSSPTPPMSMLGPLSVQNISPETGNGPVKLGPATGFHLNSTAPGE